MSKSSQATTIVSLVAAVLFLPLISIFGTDSVNAVYQQVESSIKPLYSTDNATKIGPLYIETEEEIEAKVKQNAMASTISWDSENKLCCELEKAIKNMKPTDNITVIALLQIKSDTTDKIYEATETIDATIEEISAEIRQRSKEADEEFYSEVGGQDKAIELLSSDDSAAIMRYREILEKHGADSGSIDSKLREIDRLRDARNEIVNEVLAQQYGDIQARAKAAIEGLPDTMIIGGTLDLNSLDVETKVVNVELLAQMPEVVRICNAGADSSGDGRLILGITPSFTQPISPINCFIGYPVDHPIFSWNPYKDTTKYKFVLARDSTMEDIVKETCVSSAKYRYDDTLEQSTNYFWRVMAIEPAETDWSDTFSFQTEAATESPGNEAQHQLSVHFSVLIVILVITLSGLLGFIIWFLRIRRQ